MTGASALQSRCLRDGKSDREAVEGDFVSCYALYTEICSDFNIMNTPRKVANGFSAREVWRITGLSIHMIDYLAREGYLGPTYEAGRVRGKVRFYSYRDLVVARIVQGLRQQGLQLKRLKRSIQLLSADETWFPKSQRSFDLLATDGKKLYYHDRTDSITELTPNLQRTFAFIIDVGETQEQVKKRIARLTSEKRAAYSIENRPLIYLDTRSAY
jgi:DNA-binding transcriptional MerR regulator